MTTFTLFYSCAVQSEVCRACFDTNESVRVRLYILFTCSEHIDTHQWFVFSCFSHHQANCNQTQIWRVALFEITALHLPVQSLSMFNDVCMRLLVTNNDVPLINYHDSIFGCHFHFATNRTIRAKEYIRDSFKSYTTVLVQFFYITLISVIVQT